MCLAGLVCLTLTEFVQGKSASQLGPSLETQTIYLSGHGPDDAVLWDFYCTEGRRSGVWTTIPVPSCWELQGFGTYQYGMPFYGQANPAGIAREQGIYKYRFKLPANWEGRMIRLVFEGVMTDCSAKINGRQAVKLHQGAFYRFMPDVTDRVYTGDKVNELEVTVSKESANPQVNLAERRADYWNFGGIFRPVFIEALPVTHIDRVAINAGGDGHLKAVVYLGAASSKSCQVEAQLLDAAGKPVESPFSAVLQPGSDQLYLEKYFSSVRSWNAESPVLYRLRLSLLEEGKVKHQVVERSGSEQ
jgi:beta-galactosidase/beta-glucuronidase